MPNIGQHMQHAIGTPARFAWARTLKFKLVAMAVVTGVLSAVFTAHLALTNTETGIQRQLLQHGGEDMERTAALLASKVDMLQGSLRAVARRIPPVAWQSPIIMAQYLANKPGMTFLFNNVAAVNLNGEILVHIEKDQVSTELPNLADRAYFQRAMKTDQPVVSEPLRSRANNSPAIVIAIPSLAPDGRHTGMLVGVVDLTSNSMFTDLTRTNHDPNIRTLVMDRAGVLLAHPNPERVLGRAADEPGLKEVFTRWHESGSPIDTVGISSLSEGHLVTMAGIPGSDWVIVNLTPRAAALEPVAAARRTAWTAAAGVGLLAALLAGLLSGYLARPITRLRARAERMLTETQLSLEGWPEDRGEVGHMTHAFKQLIGQSLQRQTQTEGLLKQLEAVFDHADLGIALTRNGCFELVSKQFCHLLGYSSMADLLGQSTHKIYPSEEAYQALAERARPAFMERGGFDGEVQLMRGDGTLFWAHMRGRAVVPGDRSKGTIWTLDDITQAREHREHLAWTASHDSLTGLSNRPAFEALLSRATDRAATEPFCAMFIDLDHFKQVNDTGGHAAGDALLREVAHTLAAQVRQTDTVARLGGDEFAVLLGHCPVPQALEIGEKLRSAVATYRLPWDGHQFGVGSSIGLVAVDGSYANAADVLRAADAACYAAKQRGRDCVVLYDPHTTVAAPL